MWVFVDGKLLQKEIIENGYGSVAYLYDDYKYTKILKQSELVAKNNHLGIWVDNSSNNVIYSSNYYFYIKYYYVLKKIYKY